ncbi:hypothetical protein BU23DRAFT_520311 [Bimuria novae-zelandiae CBS 107.79]|uniref:Uncharacterized protein n=1 Tax=Bimuria novae-zelandiae CBS 107.79 TaxID=1447943 RepID=A0A6A5UMA8_9PLEO|nr:hypothetical protein BU23DRAFT_520311 [Bimuria novae-zelandiae CBS 107.79]
MLASSTFYPHHHYTPPRSSPLSERSANAAPRPFQFTMTTPTPSEKTSLVAPKRAYKPNPVVQTRDAATKRRREMFFKRVQKGRDDKKWDARGEQIQLLDHISEQKRWEAEKTRQAPQLDDYVVELEVEEITSSTPVQEMTEADYILTQEEQEMQELIASMEDEHDDASQHYGSDDEDYDQLFMEYTSNMQPQSQPQYQQNTSTTTADPDAMDMS